MFFGVQTLHHFIQPTLHENKPDTVLIHIGSNDINLSKEHDINVHDVVQRIKDTSLY